MVLNLHLGYRADPASCPAAANLQAAVEWWKQRELVAQLASDSFALAGGGDGSIRGCKGKAKDISAALGFQLMA